MEYFLGRYDYAMDDRGRIPVPPRYRDSFAKGAVLAQGAPESCLRLYTEEAFQQLASLHASEPATRRTGRVARHAFFSRAFPVELDRQGRILIPGSLRSYAALEGNVVLAGVGEWLEIWSPERFDAEMADVDERLESALESLEPKS